MLDLFGRSPGYQFYGHFRNRFTGGICQVLWLYMGHLHFRVPNFPFIMINHYYTLSIIILLVLSREWMGMGVAGMIIDSYRGSFPHSLLSTSKLFNHH